MIKKVSISEILLQPFPLFLGYLYDRAMARGEVAFGWRVLHILKVLQVALAELVVAIGIAVVHEDVFIAADEGKD